MKKLYFLTMIVPLCTALGQNIPQNLGTAVADSIVINRPKVDFSAYSKTLGSMYDYNFTLDSQDYGQNKVFVGTDDKFFYQENNIFITNMPLPGQVSSPSRSDVIGGLKNLSTLFSSEKDYTKKKE